MHRSPMVMPIFFLKQQLNNHNILGRESIVTLLMFY